MLGGGAAAPQAGPGSLPMMSHCPDKQNPEIGVAALSPEIILMAFRHFRWRDWGKGGNQQKTHSLGMLGQTGLCAERGDAQGREQKGRQEPRASKAAPPEWSCRGSDGRAGATYPVSL